MLLVEAQHQVSAELAIPWVGLRPLQRGTCEWSFPTGSHQLLGDRAAGHARWQELFLEPQSFTF